MNANCAPTVDPKDLPNAEAIAPSHQRCGGADVTSNLRTGEPVDVAFMAREMSLPLIDMVMEQDEKHQGPLLAQIIGSLGNEYLERRGLLQAERRDN
jgi:hypothetical protein